MAAATLDLSVDQGATFRLVLALTQPVTSTAIDLTGYSAEMMVRKSYFDLLPLLTITSGNGGLTIGGTAGTIMIVISAAQSSAFSVPPTVPVNGYGLQGILYNAGPPTQSYVYDLDLQYPSGDIVRLVQGAFTVSAAATR